MSMLDIKSLMHRRIDELFAVVSGNSSDGDCEGALMRYQMDHYNDLASLAWFLGCDADVFQREAVPASEVANEAYFEINREREFEPAPRRRQYSAVAVRASL